MRVGRGGGVAEGKRHVKKIIKELRNSSNRTKPNQRYGSRSPVGEKGGRMEVSVGEGGVWVRVDTRCHTHRQ